MQLIMRIKQIDTVSKNSQHSYLSMYLSNIRPLNELYISSIYGCNRHTYQLVQDSLPQWHILCVIVTLYFTK